MFRRVIPVILVFLFSCTPFHQKEIENQYTFTKIPVGVIVDPELSDEWNEAILFAIQQWNEAAGIEIFETFKIENEDKYEKLVGITFIEDKENTLIYAKTYFIENAPYIIIVINNDMSFIKQRIKNQILTHEFGHTLGFFHEDDMNSIMYYEIPYRSFSNMMILEHHRKIIRNLYSK